MIGPVKLPPGPNVWGGESGDLFAAMVREQLDGEGIASEISVRPVRPEAAPSGAFLVDVVVNDGPSVLFTVANWFDGVQVIDPNGEDLTVAQALAYVGHRADGLQPRAALKLARQPT
jgi:hypothetical protein